MFCIGDQYRCHLRREDGEAQRAQLSISMSACLLVSLSVGLTSCPSVYPSLSLSLSLSVSLSVSVCVCVCLSLSLSLFLHNYLLVPYLSSVCMTSTKRASSSLRPSSMSSSIRVPAGSKPANYNKSF